MRTSLYVVDRRFCNPEESCNQLTDILHNMTKLNRRARILLRNRTERLSEQLDWANLGAHYFQARLGALDKLIDFGDEIDPPQLEKSFKMTKSKNLNIKHVVVLNFFYMTVKKHLPGNHIPANLILALFHDRNRHGAKTLATQTQNLMAPAWQTFQRSTKYFSKSKRVKTFSMRMMKLCVYVNSTEKNFCQKSM